MTRAGLDQMRAAITVGTMFLRRLSAYAAAFCVAAIPLSRADFYARVSGLYSHASDLSVNNATAFKASLKNHAGIAGAVGYKISLLRLEAELQHLSTSTEPEETSGTLLGGIGRNIGSLKETSGFANVLVDFPSFFGLAPYLGVGLGYARVNADNIGRTRNGTPVLQFSGSDSVFGYQGMLGLQFHLFGQATLHAGYRLVKREDLDVRDVLANARQSLSLGTNRLFEIGLAIGF